MEQLVPASDTKILTITWSSFYSNWVLNHFYSTPHF